METGSRENSKGVVFVIIALILHYEDSLGTGLSADTVVRDRPIFYVAYDRQREELNEIRKGYKELLEKRTSEFEAAESLKHKIHDYITRDRVEFSLGDWLAILQLSVKYAEETLCNGFWGALPDHVCNNAQISVSEMEHLFNRGGALKVLNVASHELLVTLTHLLSTAITTSSSTSIRFTGMSNVDVRLKRLV